MGSLVDNSIGLDQPVRASRSLEERVAIVTGAGAIGDGIGNGRAIAILLAEAGAAIVCVDLQLDDAQRTVEMIEQEKGRAFAHVADVSVEADCKKIVDVAVETYGRLDILVNNVGIHGVQGTAVSVDMAGWSQGMQINVASVALMAKFAVPAMLDNSIKHMPESTLGCIVNLGSVSGLIGGAPDLLYATSKGALTNMTRAMAAHHGRSGIRVNCVCPAIPPGTVYTPRMYATKKMSVDVRRRRANRSLLGVEGNGWDVAAAVRWLACDEARWITGLILPVDAGALAAIGVGEDLGH